MKPAETDHFWITWCREELNFGRTVRIVASGYSMIPTIWPETEIEISNCPMDQLCIGDIIAFQRMQHMVVHRVVMIQNLHDETFITTMGDSNLKVDEVINNGNFIGKVRVKNNTLIQSHAPVLVKRSFYSGIAFIFTLSNALSKRILRLFSSKKRH
jgi:signal peptidase I